MKKSVLFPVLLYLIAQHANAGLFYLIISSRLLGTNPPEITFRNNLMSLDTLLHVDRSVALESDYP